MPCQYLSKDITHKTILCAKETTKKSYKGLVGEGKTFKEKFNSQNKTFTTWGVWKGSGQKCAGFEKKCKRMHYRFEIIHLVQLQ